MTQQLKIRTEQKAYLNQVTSYVTSLELGSKMYVVTLSKILQERLKVPGKLSEMG